MVSIQRRFLSVVIAFVAISGRSLCAQVPKSEDLDEATARMVQEMRNRAVAYLKTQRPIGLADVASEHSTVGESALIALALIEAGVPTSDEHVSWLLGQVTQATGGGGFGAVLRGGRDNYEAGLACVALAEADADLYREAIEGIVKYLLAKQKGDGSWDYSGGRTGDTSMTQVALLGLWAAARHGVDVPTYAWDHAARWLTKSQNADGGFSYHPGESIESTHSMTAGALGSLHICRTQLEQQSDATVSLDEIDRAIARGTTWLSQNFTVLNPTGHFYYYFYSLERFTAFARLKKLGNRDWYREGLEVLKQQQRPGGAWQGRQSYSVAVQTSFALLFLVKATHGILGTGVNRLGGGALLAGRGLPSDLSLVSVKRGRLVVPPIKVTLDELLKRLRVGRAEQMVQVQTESATMETVQGMLQLARDPDPEVREKAVRSLGRLRRYDVVPPLIGALEDPDNGVRRAARDSLRRLSRKPRGFDLPDAPSPAQIQEAVRQWNQWYRSVRPYDEFDSS